MKIYASEDHKLPYNRFPLVFEGYSGYEEVLEGLPVDCAVWVVTPIGNTFYGSPKEILRDLGDPLGLLKK